MDDLELEQQAALLRARLLELWGGDAKRAEAYLRWLIDHINDVGPGLPISQRDRNRAVGLMQRLLRQPDQG